MINIINYGLGNIRAFYNIYHSLNIPVRVASSPSDLFGSTALILPGVGSFDWAMNRLNSSGMRPLLDELVLKRNLPVLGICVGMQIMANSSEEGKLAGLGWIDAEVKSMKSFSLKRNAFTLPLPHMGWNNVTSTKTHQLFNNLDHMRFYFLHSFYFKPSDPSVIIGTTDYGNKFTSAINKRNIIGVQFHPEKSHNYGMALLSNFSFIS